MKIIHTEQYQKHNIQIFLIEKNKKLITIEKDGWKIYDKNSHENLWDCIGQAIAFIDAKKRS